MENQGLFSRLHNWLTRPFNAGGSVANLAWTVLIVIIAAWLWNSVILLFMRKAREVL
jgi:hypothetical protein